MKDTEIEPTLRRVERAIAEPTARQDCPASLLCLQASWLLTAAGRWEQAVAAADLGQACWRVGYEQAPARPHGGTRWWETERAAAVAYMSVGDWRRAESRTLRVLGDFTGEDKAFYLFELCLHAQQRRPWNATQSFVVLKNPDAQLAAFDARVYGLGQYYSGLARVVTRAVTDAAEDDSDTGAQALADSTWPRWCGVPIPYDLPGSDWSAAQIHAERDPTLRECAIARFGLEGYAREVELLAREAERAARDAGGLAPDPDQRQFLADYTVRSTAAVIEHAARPGTGAGRERLERITNRWGELTFGLALLASPHGLAGWEDLSVPSGGWPWEDGPVIRSWTSGPRGGYVDGDGVELHWALGAEEICDAISHATVNGGPDAEHEIRWIAHEWPELGHALRQLLAAHNWPSPRAWRDLPRPRIPR